MRATCTYEIYEGMGNGPMMLFVFVYGIMYYYHLEYCNVSLFYCTFTLTSNVNWLVLKILAFAKNSVLCVVFGVLGLLCENSIM